MPPSNDPTSPREKNRAHTSKDPQESPQDSSFLSSKETGKHIMIQDPYETSRSSVSLVNRDEEAFKIRHGTFSENRNYFDSNNSTMNTGNLINPFCVGGSASSMGSQKYPAPMQMIPTPGYVNNSTNNKNNSGQSFLGVDASNNSVDIRTRMQQQMSNSSVIGADSSTWFAKSDEDFQRLGMPVSGEGYGTNNPDLFGDQSSFNLGSGGNIASMSSQRDSVRPEMQQKMSNVSNSSIGGGVGMYEKTIDSGTWLAHFAEDLLRLEVPGEETIDMIPNPMFAVADDAPPWIIKKILTVYDITNDVFNLSVRNETRKHIFEAYNTGNIVKVYDHDTRTMHELRVLQIFNYARMGGWQKDFVQRRSLKVGDVIGFLWDSSASRLQFGVISRANAEDAAEEKKLLIAASERLL